MLRVSIDPTRCEGHAKCLMDSPEVFDLDDQGFGFVKPEVDVVAHEHRNAVLRAVAGCPEYAISAHEISVEER
ncbi:ferredoxin [Rhodococcus sp. 27YEA15]|uniref:ferredoxin n=1 Tax=Rhodococcus sp. 27YEA15 TaxID=3156259 RepID=UPI003C7D08B6